MQIAITLDIPDAQASAIIDAIATAYNWSIAAKPGETKPAFARRVLSDALRQIVRDAMQRDAYAAAMVTANSLLASVTAG